METDGTNSHTYTNIIQAFNTVLQLRSVVQSTRVLVCININLFTSQRQQYPQLPEAAVKTKAEIWKLCDEKEQERRQALYRDVLAQQQSVSHFYA